MTMKRCEKRTLSTQNDYSSADNSTQMEVNEWKYTVAMFILAATMMMGKFSLHYGMRQINKNQ